MTPARASVRTRESTDAVRESGHRIVLPQKTLPSPPRNFIASLAFQKTRKNCLDVITLRNSERYDQLFLFCQSTVWIGRCEMDVCVYVLVCVYTYIFKDVDVYI